MAVSLGGWYSLDFFSSPSDSDSDTSSNYKQNGTVHVKLKSRFQTLSIMKTWYFSDDNLYLIIEFYELLQIFRDTGSLNVETK